MRFIFLIWSLFLFYFLCSFAGSICICGCMAMQHFILLRIFQLVSSIFPSFPDFGTSNVGGACKVDWLLDSKRWLVSFCSFTTSSRYHFSPLFFLGRFVCFRRGFFSPSVALRMFVIGAFLKKKNFLNCYSQELIHHHPQHWSGLLFKFPIHPECWQFPIIECTFQLENVICIRQELFLMSLSTYVSYVLLVWRDGVVGRFVVII